METASRRPTIMSNCNIAKQCTKTCQSALSKFYRGFLWNVHEKCRAVKIVIIESTNGTPAQKGAAEHTKTAWHTATSQTARVTISGRINSDRKTNSQTEGWPGIRKQNDTRHIIWGDMKSLTQTRSNESQSIPRIKRLTRRYLRDMHKKHHYKFSFNNMLWVQFEPHKHTLEGITKGHFVSTYWQAFQSVGYDDTKFLETASIKNN